MTKAKKVLIAVVAIVVALLVAIDIAVSGYLVNYAIGRAGDGGDRNVEEVVIETEGTEARIEAERAAQAQETAEFLNAVPGESVEIAAADGVHLAGITYEHDDTDNRWALVIHGYRSSHESDSVLDMTRHYYDAGFDRVPNVGVTVVSPDA